LTKFLRYKFHSIKIELQNQLKRERRHRTTNSKINPKRLPLRGLRDGTANHPRLNLRTSGADPILVRTEMRRIHRVGANFAPFDPYEAKDKRHKLRCLLLRRKTKIIFYLFMK
jgi:hypothetical protein